MLAQRFTQDIGSMVPCLVQRGEVDGAMRLCQQLVQHPEDEGNPQPPAFGCSDTRVFVEYMKVAMVITKRLSSSVVYITLVTQLL